MPRENKKRGRRENNKRKRDEEGGEASPKRQRVIDELEIEVHGDAGDDFIGFGASTSQDDAPQHQFYGLLEPEEQEYYSNVNNKISANDFDSEDDRALFIQAVHRETEGKVMKVASSQSCSRYLEKVIMLSTPGQLETLFSAFLENLPYLVQHRFGSHCCETLFTQAAKFITTSNDKHREENGLEPLFLQAVEQLEPNIGFLLTERFASHTIRVLLLVLSGQSMLDESTKSVVASRRKEKLEMAQPIEEPTERRKIPESFRKALRHMTVVAVSAIDTTYMRALATHPVGNPVLQLLLRLELTTAKPSREGTEQSLLRKLLPDEELEADSESGRFIQGLIYDPTGSHLVETVIQYVPGKIFKKLYKNIFKERMRNISKNDVASYVAIRLLERLGKDDLTESRDAILPELQGMVSRSRTGLLKVLFERCAVRQVDTKPLVEAVRHAYDADLATVLVKLLHFSPGADDSVVEASDTKGSHEQNASAKADLHGSLLAQAMLQVPGACNLIQQSMLAQPQRHLLSMAMNVVASRVIQVALTSDLSTAQFRRQLIPKFYGHAAELAQDSAGSHIVDALWEATSQLHFMKEILAKELREAEPLLRESVYGRSVWRNWAMDTYSRRVAEWQAMAKSREQDRPQLGDRVEKKSAIQLARERHLVKARKDDKSNAV